MYYMGISTWIRDVEVHCIALPMVDQEIGSIRSDLYLVVYAQLCDYLNANYGIWTEPWMWRDIHYHHSFSNLVLICMQCCMGFLMHKHAHFAIPWLAILCYFGLLPESVVLQALGNDLFGHVERQVEQLLAILNCMSCLKNKSVNSFHSFFTNEYTFSDLDLGLVGMQHNCHIPTDHTVYITHC